jgi:ribosomal protein S18 acetylase RimI-like enzyme
MRMSRASPGDFDRVWTFFADVISDMHSKKLDYWNEKYPTREMVGQDLEDRTLYLLEDRNRLAAVFTMDDVKPPEYAGIQWLAKDGKNLYVHRFAVTPELQGKGIAGTVMDFVEKHALKHGYETVRLDTYSGNPPGLKLYRGRGYEETGLFTLEGWKKVFVCFEKIIER